MITCKKCATVIAQKGIYQLCSKCYLERFAPVNEPLLKWILNYIFTIPIPLQVNDWYLKLEKRILERKDLDKEFMDNMALMKRLIENELASRARNC